MQKLVRRLKVTHVLKFLTISFLLSWIFAIMAENRRLLVLFRVFTCWSQRLRIFVALGDSSRVWESWSARLTKSGVDIVSHSILVLFTRRERSQFSALINIELKATQVEQTSEGRPEFSLKNNLKLIVKFMNRFIRFLCARLNFVSINRLWKNPRNCLMKLPSDCPSLIT